MIAIPEGWRQLTSVGADVHVNPGRTLQMRYECRVAPLRRFAEIVDAALAAMPEWRTNGPTTRQRIVTTEGEYAYGIALSGTWLGAPAQRYLGVVYGDDFMNVLDMLGVEADGLPGAIESQARALLASSSLALGLRTRRYFYEQPATWHGHATGLVTHWLPARFPSRPTMLVVYPAAPTYEEPFAVHDALVGHERALGATVEHARPMAEITARDGLGGLHWSLTCTTSGRVVHRDLVVLARAPYTYAMQLDAFRSVDADAQTTFLALARSVEPLPTAGATTADLGADGGAFANVL